MDKIKILIVEDEWITSEEIKEILKKNQFHVVGQAEDAASALDLVANETPDIALLDINIKGELDGIELAKKLRSQHDLAIIFLTAYDDNRFLDRAKEVDPEAYIVKPFQEKNLVVALKMAFQKMATQQKNEEEEVFVLKDRIFLKDGTRFYKVGLNSILYVEADGSYCKILTQTNKYTLAINLKNFESKIEHPSILRCHRSYLVNLEHIDAIEGNQLFIGDKSIPISQSQYDQVIKRLKLI